MTSTSIVLSEVSDNFDDLFFRPLIRGRTLLASTTNSDDPLDPWTNSVVLTSIEPRRVPSCYVPSPLPRRPLPKRPLKNKNFVVLRVLTPIAEQDGSST